MREEEEEEGLPCKIFRLLVGLVARVLIRRPPLIFSLTTAQPPVSCSVMMGEGPRRRLGSLLQPFYQESRQVSDPADCTLNHHPKRLVLPVCRQKEREDAALLDQIYYARSRFPFGF